MRKREDGMTKITLPEKQSGNEKEEKTTHSYLCSEEEKPGEKHIDEKWY